MNTSDGGMTDTRSGGTPAAAPIVPSRSYLSGVTSDPRTVDWKQEWEIERQKFQRETLRSSQLTTIVRRFVDEHHVRGGHPAERWTKECDLCVILADALVVLREALPPVAPEPNKLADEVYARTRGAAGRGSASADAALREQNAKLHEALKTYGQHRRGCPHPSCGDCGTHTMAPSKTPGYSYCTRCGRGSIPTSNETCDCGFDAALEVRLTVSGGGDK